MYRGHIQQYTPKINNDDEMSDFELTIDIPNLAWRAS